MLKLPRLDGGSLVATTPAGVAAPRFQLDRLFPVDGEGLHAVAVKKRQGHVLGGLGKMDAEAD